MPNPTATQYMIQKTIAQQLGLLTTTGTIYYVDSTSIKKLDSPSNGRSPLAPLATLAYAASISTTFSTASKGDIIVLMPGHTETITAAAGVVLAAAGTTVVGLGSGRNRPIINYTTAVGASLNITAANCLIQNVVFTPIGFDNITAAVNVSAADATFLNCDFQHANATNQAALCILTTAAADRLTIDTCRFYGTTDAGTATAVRIVGGDGHRIMNSIFSGAYTSSLGGIENNTTACTNTIVVNNQINNLTAASTKAMVFAAGSTGQISGNRMQILSGTAPITGAAMSWVGQNYYAATIATAGTLI